MRRLSLIGFVLFALIVLSNSAAFGASSTLKYQVFLTQMQLYNSGTGEWVTVYEGTSTALDIAAVNSGESVGNFLSGANVPDGTYTRAKAFPSPTFVIRGSVTSGGTTYYTTVNTATAGGRTASVASTTLANMADCTVTVLSTDVAPPAAGTTFSNGSVTVTNGVPDHKVRVAFDLSDALTYDAGGGTIRQGEPGVTITVE